MLIFPRAPPPSSPLPPPHPPRPRIWHSWHGAERYSLAPTLFPAPGTRAYFEGHSKERQERGGGPSGGGRDTRMMQGREGRVTLMCVSVEEACMRACDWDRPASLGKGARFRDAWPWPPWGTFAMGREIPPPRAMASSASVRSFPLATDRPACRRAASSPPRRRRLSGLGPYMGKERRGACARERSRTSEQRRSVGSQRTVFGGFS